MFCKFFICTRYDLSLQIQEQTSFLAKNRTQFAVDIVRIPFS